MKNIIEKSKVMLGCEHTMLPTHLKDFVERHFDEIAEMFIEDKNKGESSDSTGVYNDARFACNNLEEFLLSSDIVSTLQNHEFMLTPKGLSHHLLICHAQLRNFMYSVRDCHHTIQMFNESPKCSKLFDDFDCTDTAEKLSSLLCDDASILEKAVKLAKYFEESNPKIFAVVKYMAMENVMIGFFKHDIEFDSYGEIVLSSYVDYIVRNFDHEMEFCKITASNELGIELSEEERVDPYTYSVMSYLLHIFNSIFYSI